MAAGLCAEQADFVIKTARSRCTKESAEPILIDEIVVINFHFHELT
jgi:hypothetical protein